MVRIGFAVWRYQVCIVGLVVAVLGSVEQVWAQNNEQLRYVDSDRVASEHLKVAELDLKICDGARL
jgi:hypothetical protein